MLAVGTVTRFTFDSSISIWMQKQDMHGSPSRRRRKRLIQYNKKTNTKRTAAQEEEEEEEEEEDLDKIEHPVGVG